MRNSYFLVWKAAAVVASFVMLAVSCGSDNNDAASPVDDQQPGVGVSTTSTVSPSATVTIPTPPSTDLLDVESTSSTTTVVAPETTLLPDVQEPALVPAPTSLPALPTTTSTAITSETEPPSNEPASTTTSVLSYDGDPGTLRSALGEMFAHLASQDPLDRESAMLSMMFIGQTIDRTALDTLVGCVHGSILESFDQQTQQNIEQHLLMYNTPRQTEGLEDSVLPEVSVQDATVTASAVVECSVSDFGVWADNVTELAATQEANNLEGFSAAMLSFLQCFSRADNLESTMVLATLAEIFGDVDAALETFERLRNEECKTLFDATLLTGLDIGATFPELSEKEAACFLPLVLDWMLDNYFEFMVLAVTNPDDDSFDTSFEEEMAENPQAILDMLQMLVDCNVSFENLS